VLDDVRKLLTGLKNILVEDGNMYFTTLVKGRRIADGYLHALGNAAKLVVRNIDQLQTIFDQLGMSVKYNIKGNMAFIYYR
jgi:hypothetical protein